jgi:hypothetical protein
VALDPNRPIYITSPSPWAQANGQLVDRVMSLFGLVSSPSWCISALFRHVSHRVQGSTEFQTLARVKVSGMISTVPYIRRLMYPGALSSIEVLLKSMLCSVSNLRSATAEFSLWFMLVCPIYPLHLVSMALNNKMIQLRSRDIFIK